MGCVNFTVPKSSLLAGYYIEILVPEEPCGFLDAVSVEEKDIIGFQAETTRFYELAYYKTLNTATAQGDKVPF